MITCGLLAPAGRFRQRRTAETGVTVFLAGSDHHRSAHKTKAHVRFRRSLGVGSRRQMTRGDVAALGAFFYKQAHRRSLTVVARKAGVMLGACLLFASC